MTRRKPLRIKALVPLLLIALAATLLPYPSSAIELPRFIAPPLLVLPDDGVRPIIQIIGSARSRIDVVSQSMEADAIQEALASAAKRGVKVSVMLDKYPSGHGLTKQDLEKRISSSGIFMRFGNPKFRTTKEHLIIVDGNAAYVSTLALTTDALSHARGFVVRVLDSRDVKEIVHVFEADWNRSTPSLKSARLAWSPTQCRSVIYRLIMDAHQTLSIYTEAAQDDDTIRLFGRAVERGVRVRMIIGNAAHGKPSWATQLEQRGVRVSILKKPTLMANVLIVDAGTKTGRALVGSIDFSAPSLDEDRGLAVVVSNASEVERLASVFTADASAADESVDRATTDRSQASY
jgi:phosphatidylserine/phosphatidylglycerophosphate/cardiolipin synthase-like enzyme